MARFANNVERKTLANILADMAVVCDSEMQVVIAATVCICTAHLSGNTSAQILGGTKIAPCWHHLQKVRADRY